MIKKLSKSIREYKWSSLLTPFFVTLEVIMEIIIPLVTANLIDNGLYGGNMDVVYKVGLQLVLCAILALVFGFFSGRFAAKAASGFAKNLRQDLYYKVEEFSFSNIDKFSTASLITRLTTDVSNVQNAFAMIIRIAVRSPLMLVSSLLMVININPKISIIYIVIIPIIGLGLYLIIKKVFPLMNRIFKTYDKLNNVVEENVSGIRVVKSFVQEEQEKEKFSKVSNSIYNDFSKAEKLMALNNPLLQTAIYSCMIFISWFGAKIIVNSHMTELTTGQLMTLFTYTSQILFSLLILSMIFVMIIISRTSAKRIIEVLDEKIDLVNPKNPIYEIKNGDIKFDNVGFSYVNDKKKEVLKNINLEIKSGETIGIIGGTGSSKTSLMNLIPRLYDVTEGKVLVGDIDVKNYDIKSLRDAVAVVLQKNVLFSGTIKENLKYGDENATDEEMQEACVAACCDDFIQKLPDKYDTYIEQGGTNVSGGQKQRLCIARALLKKPKILILDDSTSAVDTKTDSLIRTSLKKLLPGTTKIIIAQRISSVMDADRIIVIDKGKINGIGNHEELLKNNKIYTEVYESQTKGSDNNE